MAGIDLFRSFRCNTNRTGRKEPPASPINSNPQKVGKCCWEEGKKKNKCWDHIVQRTAILKMWKTGLLYILKDKSQSQIFRNEMDTSLRNRSPNFTNGKIWCLKRMQRQTTDWEKIFAKTQMTKDCYLKHTHKELFKLNSFLKIWFKRGLKTSTDTSPKTHKWQITMWKDTLYNMSSGKPKLKQQWIITTHQLKWQKSRTQSSNADKDVKQQELFPLLTGMQNGTANFGRQFGSFYKTKHSLTIQSTIMLLGIYPNQLKI